MANPTPVAPEDVSDHPLAVALRALFWRLEKLFDEFEDLEEEQIRAALRDIRDNAKVALIATPTAATPIVATVLPSINAAIKLIEDSQQYEAGDLLIDLRGRLAPSPALGSNRID